MKKVFSFLFARLLYWLGLLVLRVILENMPNSWIGTMLYNAYNNLMIWSYSLELWAKTSYVWKRTKDDQ